MAPIKFEEEIKDKLEARKIEPSINSWKKLSEQLDKDESKGKNRFWWLAIAASFLLILFTVIQISKSPEEIVPKDRFSIQEPSQLETPVKSIDEEKESFETQATKIQQVVEVEEDKLKVKSKPKVSTSSNSVYVAENTKVAKGTTEVTTNEALVVEESIEINDAIASNEIDKSMIQKVLEETKSRNPKDIDKETDSLLKAAQKELLLDKAMIENSTVVNANDLLMEVEEEVEPSLKSKVYDVFKGGFKKVKTAVAQRKN